MHKTPHGGSTFGISDAQKLHAAVAKSTFGSEHVQNMWCSEHFGSSDVEKLPAAVARSTFASENVPNTFVLAHFLNFRCRKISQLASSSVNQSVR